MKVKEAFTKIDKLHEYVALAIVDAKDYQATNLEFVKTFVKKKVPGVYVTLSKPYETLVREFEYLSDAKNIKFIDCISRAAGITKDSDNCVFVESPTMLEKLSLEIMNIFKEVDENTKKYLVVDSLTNLIIYNDPDIVTEFFYYIINRTRTKDIHTISLAIEEEELDKYLNRLIYLNDKILKVRDSFI